jgi:hypothetical protein
MRRGAIRAPSMAAALRGWPGTIGRVFWFDIRTESTMRRLPAILAALWPLVAGPTFACAVATEFDLSNETGQRIRTLSITDDTRLPSTEPRVNILPPEGIAPGASLRLRMPSCMGLYVMTATLADGTVRQFPGLDARRMRALAVR